MDPRPQYAEIFKYGEVKGISIVFVTVDLLGGVFSDLSLIFRPKFDVLAGVAYSLVVVSTGGTIAPHMLTVHAVSSLTELS